MADLIQFKTGDETGLLGNDGHDWGIERIIDARLYNISALCGAFQNFCKSSQNQKTASPLFETDINLVLSELLSNIILHGYQNSGDGHIEARARFIDNYLEIILIDQGSELPRRVLTSRDVEIEKPDPFDLPEGGFGWGIVHAIIADIRYQRTHNSNRLLLRKPVSGSLINNPI